MTTHAPGTFCWIELATTNAARARAFYTQLFDWTATDNPMPGSPGGTYTRFALDGHAVAGLFEIDDSERGIPAHWASYIASDDIDLSIARVNAAGGSVIEGPLDIPGVGRMVVCRDPTGSVVSLYQAGAHTGFGVSGEPGSYCWSELYTKDPDTAARFYTDALGWSVKSDDGQDMTYYEFATPAGRFIAGMMEIQPEWGPVPPQWAVYIQVADLDASLERARALGGTVRMGEKVVPEVGRFATLADPTGASFSIIEMARR